MQEIVTTADDRVPGQQTLAGGASVVWLPRSFLESLSKRLRSLPPVAPGGPQRWKRSKCKLAHRGRDSRVVA